MVNGGGSDFGLVAGIPEFGEHRTPRVDNHAVAIAHSFVIVLSYLDR